ncbi:hypothetical protein Glove_87g232 [Diversispora epigaea]|uniref:SAM domain-containing protein n=1 Tax=Diversispora epigaea TaxID=1348612 RepID=A0A397JF38_9GLOM|nr:hypothetical protein Glove_87g232 [Diversispora epigaea]
MSIPTVEVVDKWSPKDVIGFLESKKVEKYLDNDDINIIKKNKVSGKAFLMLTPETLERWGMLGGPADVIARLAKEIKGDQGKKWMVNSVITREERSIVYYADPTEWNGPLLDSIHRGEFVALHGQRASGKSTRVLSVKDKLQEECYVCLYVSLEQVNIESVEKFWSTFGDHLYLEASEYNELSNISSANDFAKAFQKSKWKNRVVLIIDEFDKLYRANEDVRSSCLETFRGFKASISNYSIWSIVAVGPFSILHLRSNNLTTSPYNVNNPIRNPNFTFEQVHFLYKQFADEYKLTIDQEVIEDIYIQTNGHAGLVCLCGRAIYRKILLRLDKKRHISFDIWKHFSVMLLGGEIIEYQAFLRMKDALLMDDLDTRRAVKLLRTNFMSNIDFVPVAENQMDLAFFLTAEGVLIPGEDFGTFKISSPLVRWLILQRIIPQVFPSSPKVEVPYHSSSQTLDILEILKQAIRTFDKENMGLAFIRSSKKVHVNVNKVKNQRVPRESVYDAELYRILSNWLIGFQITGQWHLIRRTNGRNYHKYTVIAITASEHDTVVLELLATATHNDLAEHFERALNYAKLLSAGETWIVHFTCEDNVTENPYWPGDRKLKEGLRVVHIWHDHKFTEICMIACWWNANDNTKHVTDVEKFMVHILWIGHLNDISSILIPKSGEPNIDSLEANPFQTKKNKGRNQKCIIKPEIIMLDPTFIGKVDRTLREMLAKERKEEEERLKNCSKKQESCNRSRENPIYQKKNLRKKQNHDDNPSTMLDLFTTKNKNRKIY